MLRWILTGCVLCTCVQMSFAQEGGPALGDGYRLPMSFPTGGYWPQERMASAAQRAGVEDKWEYARKLLTDLKTQHHWNTVWVLNIGLEDAKKFLRIAEEVGMWVVLEPTPVTHHFIWISHASPEAIRQTAQRTVKELGQYKALAGYVFVDEPNVISMGFLENMRREIKALDPTRICLTVTMLRDTEAAARRTELPVIVTDVYPFGYPRDPNLPNKPPASRAYYRLAARYLNEVTAQTGKRPWMMPQIFQDIWGRWYYDKNQHVVAEAGAYLHWRMPTVGETRWQIWCALANNAKGVIFYVLFPPHHPRKKGEPQKRVPKAADAWPKISDDLPTGTGRAMLYPDGTVTPQMAAASDAFGFIRKHAALLDRLEPLKPQLAYCSPPAFAHSFRDPDGGKTYVIVYTDQTEEASTASISFLGQVKSVRDLRSGKSLGARKETGGLIQTQVPLRPGDGTLLAVDIDEADLPLLVASEDFALTSMTGRLGNTKRIIVRRPYGLGWEHCLVSDPGKTQPPPSGTVTYQLMGAGASSRRVPITSYPKDATVYVVYRGMLARGDQESLVLAMSADGEKFDWAAIGLPDLPVAIPRSAKTLRFEIKPGARLYGFELVAVPTADGRAR